MRAFALNPTACLEGTGRLTFVPPRVKLGLEIEGGLLVIALTSSHLKVVDEGRVWGWAA